MFRFMVFAGANYYPTGPDDFKKAFTTFDEASNFRNDLVKNERWVDWADVYEFDVSTGSFRRAG